MAAYPADSVRPVAVTKCIYFACLFLEVMTWKQMIAAARRKRVRAAAAKKESRWREK